MLLINDRLSDLIAKGEVVARYYNPGNLFDEVDLVLLNDDSPDPEGLAPMFGNARVEVFSRPLPPRLFTRTLGWRPRLLRGWAREFVELAKRRDPDLVRCYGVGLNSFAASEIRRVLSIPYVVSLHGNPDVDYARGRLGRTTREKLQGHAIDAVEVASLRQADVVLPVYSPIVPYLREHGIERYEVVYNAVGYGHRPKADYRIDPDRVNAVCVGRQQVLQKDPRPIVRAVAEVPGLHLRLIGDGDLHDPTVELAADLGISGRISFDRALPNDKVLEAISRADFYVYSSINYEISKTCIEAALTGLPIVINDRNGEPATELQGDHFRLVSGSAESYRDAMNELIADDAEREALGRRARDHALEHWAPEKQERRTEEIYRSVMAESARDDHA